MDNEIPRITIRDHTGARHDLPKHDATYALSEAIRKADQVRALRTEQSIEIGRPISGSVIHGGGKERG